MTHYPMGPSPGQDWHDWYRTVYLKSERWRKFSYAFRSSRGWICEECGRCYSKRGHRHKLHTDHKHYDNLGRETYDDVRARCYRCHTPGITSDSTVRRNRQAMRELRIAWAIIKFIARWGWWLLKWTAKICVLLPFAALIAVAWLVGLVLLILAAPTWLKKGFEDLCEWAYEKLFRL